MSGTAVETVPGGLIDRMLATGTTTSLAAVREAGKKSAYADAMREVDRLATGDTSEAAWRHYAWHGCWLALPDGAAQRMGAIGLKFAERPPRPSRDAVLSTESRIVGRLLTDLRDIRASLQPHLLHLHPAAVEESRTGIQQIDEVRAAIPDHEDISGHLSLLAADLAARAGHEWQDHWQTARQQLTAVGDARGMAAAALVAGDWYAAPLTSPLGWNCVLAFERISLASELPNEVEEQEFAGSAPDLSQASAAYDDAAERYSALGDSAGLAAVTLRRGYLAVLSGRPGEAVALAERARKSFEEADRPLDTAVATIHVALAAIADGRLPEDLRLADAVVDAGRKRIGHSAALGLGLMCVRVARCWARRDVPDHALAALGLAERIWMGLGEGQLRAQTFVDIGQIAASTGDVAAARVAALGALAADPAPLAEPADPTDTRRVRRAMQAAWMFNMASGMADQHGMSLASTTLLETLEPLRIGLPGYSGHGLALATNLVTLLDLPGMRIASVLYRARAALQEGDTDRVIELFIEARAVLDTLRATGRDHSEALLKAYEGDFPGASAAYDKYFQSTLPADSMTGRGLSEARMLHVQGMGFQLNMENAARARFHYEALAATADPWWSGLGPGWRNLGLLARLFAQEGDFPAALAAADEALAEIEAVRATLRRDDVRRSFFASADVQHLYFDATLIALGLAEHALAADDRETARRGHAAAFDYAERARGRALLDLMLGDRGVEHAGLPADLVTRWRAASAEVALAQARLAAADQRGAQTTGDLSAGLGGAVSGLRAVEDELRSIAPRFSAMVNPQAEVSDLDAVADALPDRAILVQYAIRRTDLLAWAISRHGVVARHRMAGEHGIAHLVSSVVDGCARGAEYEAPARRLADLLLKPLRDAVEGAASLLIVPSGPTLRLPFGVLPWDGAPLAEKFPLTFLPSASALCAVREPNRGDGGPLIVGDPAGMEFTAAPGESPIPAPALPGSRLEAAYVARLSPGSTLLLGEEATRTAVRRLLPGAAVAHFATHGVLDADSPLASAVLLASGESLTAAEMVGQRVGADLIVLSACHTGTGELVRGDELLGLGRALLAAGARSVVVSLWAVDDLSAALLMAEFYRRRSAGSSDRDALRLACRHVRSLDRDRAQAACAQLQAADPSLADALQQPARTLGTWPSKSTPYAHPRHWAPFMLISTG